MLINMHARVYDKIYLQLQQNLRSFITALTQLLIRLIFVLSNTFLIFLLDISLLCMYKY